MVSQSTSSNWLDRSIFPDKAKLFRLEHLLIFLILVIAIISRFAILGERVMSHDEVNHVVPSYDLYQGRGYRHDPITHGPFQFHIIALTYFLFGDSDFTARIPAAIFSVAAVAFVIFAYRRYLGRAGAILAGVLFLISPYMLFYGRYTRNEAFIELFGVLMLYAILRYLDRGDRFAIFLLTLSLVMHFVTKETAFIYAAQALMFLAIIFLVEVRRILMHRNPASFNRFLLFMAAALLLVIAALSIAVIKADQAPVQGSTPAYPAPVVGPELLRQVGEVITLGGAVICGVLAMLLLAREIGWKQIRGIRSFSLLVLIGTLVLPMLSPFPVSLLGWNAIDYSSSTSIARTAVFVVAAFLIAIGIGWWWNARLWLANAALFYSIFTVFYTTFFTNGFGFFTGIVGSLGYWLSQQSVERGSQPLYYYALVQLPVYEFLAVLGTLLAIYFGIRYNRFFTLPGYSPAHAPRSEEELPAEALPNPGKAYSNVTLIANTETYQVKERAAVDEPDTAPRDETPDLTALYACTRPLPVLLLFVFWGLTSLIAYSIAGEKMPWLTVHITLPLLLASGWGLGYLVDKVEWQRIANRSGLLAVLLLPVLFASLSGALIPLLSDQPPFAGNTLDQLRVTSRFIVSAVAFIASLVGILYLLRDWRPSHVLRLMTVVFFLLMGVLTARAAYRASFINYDYATEYLVYAHAAPGPKEALRQIEEISRRITGGKSIQVGYSNDGLYPYWWYLRDYPNHRWFQDNPTRDLRDFPIIIAGEDVFSKIEPIVAENYTRYDYMRLWWPNQEYFNLTWDRVWGAISDPQMRTAIFKIWLNRDYSDYGKLIGKESEFRPESWSPGARMRLYIRNDIVAQIWNYGASPSVASQEEIDPYGQNLLDISPQQVVGSGGAQPGQFNAPRGVKIAPDGTLYIADSKNHRIQHLSTTGEVLHVWGTFADQATGNAPGGTFNEPWDLAISPDGSIYVSDTWNHRVQKFTADGQFVNMWGYFGQGEAPDAFWGPRGLATDSEGRVFVMDTGNDRVVIFDADGNYISQFGTEGFDRGQFDEPVGIAIDQKSGKIFITDAWNQRIQVFLPGAELQFFTPILSWEFEGWLGQSTENKPFLAVSPVNGNLFVTDPEAPRIVEFDQEGNFIRAWGEFSSSVDGFGLTSGVAVDQDGNVWVTDGVNNYLLRFVLP